MSIASSAFFIGLLCGSLLIALSLAGILMAGFRFWPPPDSKSWQYKIFWFLFRTFFIALVVLCITDFHQLGTPSLVASAVGWLVFAVGFAAASVISAKLGWENAHGEAIELKIDGWFAYSRNPIYVATIVGMIGLAIAVNSVLVIVLLLLWLTMYLLAPLAEEPWLEKQYGAAYKDYCAKVPRFVGRVGLH